MLWRAGAKQLLNLFFFRDIKSAALIKLFALTPLIFLGSVAMAQASGNAVPLASRESTIDGVKLHYLTAGTGPAVLLLHGYTQTSRMWKPIIPLLAAKF